MLYCSLLLLCCFGFGLIIFCSATDSITKTKVISDPGFIESNGSVFRLGFFSPNGSTNRYVGIWYNTAVPKVLWVANTENPLTNSSGVFKVSEQGNLVVSYGENEVLWSTNVSNSGANSTSAQLLDSGNLVLQEVNGDVLWQSFDHPGDSFWSPMMLSSNTRTDKRRDYKTVIIVAAVLGSAAVLIILFISLKCRSGRNSGELLMFNRGDENETPPFSDNDVDHAKLQEMPLYSFEQLATATRNFDAANKLGQGGFGPVYKGTFVDGKEIAVKRLSRASGQGLAEFMNEVVVISKLQHRNLVRLLGCCVEKDEKMLIYEYMPKKSLDAYLFDPLKQGNLQWRKRYEIMEGIGRGLLYLHRDSRLRIIHRDLKPSNILLDAELNPKISDFGMARIFESNQDQANTLRVVGTYGYMSPEYAMEGRFSEKSDVFSFGVLLLEIVSGRRNTSFHQDDSSLSLLGLVWSLWNEGRTEALIDPALSNSNGQRQEILRCIHIGLLCVQELASDRPSVSTILPMLTSEILDLPRPKQPAFVTTGSSASLASAVRISTRVSVNRVTITEVQGR
ncbi:hypothetical protein QQ045_032472 [Rhodiola kirilowii]